MVKRNRINEICEAIAEIKQILVSPDIKNQMLKETLKNHEIELLNELYDEKLTASSRTKKTQKRKTTNVKEAKMNRKITLPFQRVPVQNSVLKNRYYTCVVTAAGFCEPPKDGVLRVEFIIQSGKVRGIQTQNGP